MNHSVSHLTTSFSQYYGNEIEEAILALRLRSEHGKLGKGSNMAGVFGATVRQCFRERFTDVRSLVNPRRITARESHFDPPRFGKNYYQLSPPTYT